MVVVVEDDNKTVMDGMTAMMMQGKKWVKWQRGGGAGACNRV
jgi:hypothetical protein